MSIVVAVAGYEGLSFIVSLLSYLTDEWAEEFFL